LEGIDMTIRASLAILGAIVGATATLPDTPRHPIAQKSALNSTILAQLPGSDASPEGWDIQKEFEKKLHEVNPKPISKVPPQAIAAALTKDPGLLPIEPEFSTSHIGMVEPVSLLDAQTGAIGEFVVNFGSKTPALVSSLTPGYFAITPLPNEFTTNCRSRKSVKVLWSLARRSPSRTPKWDARRSNASRSLIGPLIRARTH
jgi:hypothetical protein